MPVLKFLCPTTRAYFDSGIRLDETSAAASRLKIVSVRCRQCRREHRFLLADGVLDSSDGFRKRRISKAGGAKDTLPHTRVSAGQRDFGMCTTVENYLSP
jgi:hypothetical protein